jgi:ATP-dependent helicase HrpB
VVEGERRGVGPEAARAAALLGERPLRREDGFAPGRRLGPRAPTLSARSDVLESLELLAQGGERGPGIDRGVVQAVQRTERQISRALRPARRAPPADREDALLLALLAGFPDRVARRRKAHAPELLLAGGGSAVLDPQSVVQEPLLLLALDAEQRQGPRGSEVRVRVASAIEPEWLWGCSPTGSPTKTGSASEETGRVERCTSPTAR